jgi:hypothetical protein
MKIDPALRNSAPPRPTQRAATPPEEQRKPNQRENTIKKIEQRCGKICVPKMAIPKIGWLAYGEDPAGNVFGIMEPNEKAK